MSILFNEKARVPRDSKGKPVVDNAQERIDLLVQEISSQKAKIILPAPAVAEFMLLAQDKWNDYLTIIRRKSVFEIAGFDDAEVVELVQLCLQEGKIRSKQSSVETWAKMKYDRQIVAIAKSRRVQMLYSTDSDIHKLAAKLGIKARNLIDLPSPGPKQLLLQEGLEETNVVEFPTEKASGEE